MCKWFPCSNKKKKYGHPRLNLNAASQIDVRMTKQYAIKILIL